MNITAPKPIKVALVLGSGGSKGAYQLGVAKALNEIGISYHIITGASIGALNGAILTMQDLPLLAKLWQEIEIENILENGVNLDFEEAVKKNLGKSLKLIQSIYLKGGLDITPFRQFISKYLDIEKIKKSPLKFGITISDFPLKKDSKQDNFFGEEIDMQKVDSNLIIDYLLASSSYRPPTMPFFPPITIKGKKYIDGAFFDYLPINFAFKLGADFVIAVDLRDVSSHKEYLNDPRVRYIKSYHLLGSPMYIQEQRLSRNEQLGYLDALKAFHILNGFYFSFYVFQDYDERGQNLKKLLEDSAYKKVKELLTGPIWHKLTPRGLYLRLLEVIGLSLELDYLKIYALTEFIEEIENKLQEEIVSVRVKNDEDIEKLFKGKLSLSHFRYLSILLNEKYIFSPKLQLELAKNYPELFLFWYHFHR